MMRALIFLAVLALGVPAQAATITSSLFTANTGCDATSGNQSDALPAATGSRRIFTYQKIDASGNTCTLSAAGADTIQGLASVALAAQWEMYTVQDWTAGSWRIVSPSGMSIDAGNASLPGARLNILPSPATPGDCLVADGADWVSGTCGAAAAGMNLLGTNGTVTPAGGSAAQALPALYGQRTLTPYDFGGVGDGQRLTCNITTVGTALTVNSGSCAFGAPDVGKLLVVNKAGAVLTTGPISAIAVTGAGSAYTAIPTITITSATGARFVPTPIMGLDTAAVATGGAGCTNGVQTFTVSGGTQTTPAQFTGTVTANALAGALTPTVAGNYSVLPSTSAASVTGGGCSTAPTISNTWHLNSVTVKWTGYGYAVGATTAAITGTATLGTPTVTPVNGVLATTIAAVTDPTHITMGAAGTDVTALSTQVSWSSNDAAAVAACISVTAKKTGGATAACYIPPVVAGVGGVSLADPQVPGFWGVGSAVSMQPNGFTANIAGAGRRKSVIMAMASMQAVLLGSTGYSEGGTMSDIGVDGNKLATSAVEAPCPVFQHIYRSKFVNAATGGQDLLLGRDGNSSCPNYSLVDVELTNEPDMYTGFSDQPKYNLYASDNTADSATYNLYGINAVDTCILANGAETVYYKPHCYANGTGSANAAVGAHALQSKIRFNEAIFDADRQIAIQLSATEAAVVGGLVEGAGSADTIGVSVDSGVDYYTITGMDLRAVANLDQTRTIVLNGTIGTHKYIFGNPGGTNTNQLSSTPPGDPNTSMIMGNGAGALISGSTGSYQFTALGAFAGATNVTGVGQTSVGYFAGNASTGASGTFLGSFAGTSVSSGTNTTCIGASACVGLAASKVTGNGNTAVGKGALSGIITTANNNSALGPSAGSKITTGALNVAIGASVASTTLTTGSNNVLIGTSASVDTASSSTSNTIGIGAGSTCIFCATGAGTVGTALASTPGQWGVGKSMRATGQLTTGFAGPGVEIGWTGTAGQVKSYDYTAVAAQPMSLDASTLAINLSGNATIAGGTLTGLPAPSAGTDAVNKTYADSIASGIVTHAAAQAATTANLNATQFGTGVGATLTNAGAQAAFATDGYSASLNDRILVKDQTLTQHNGIYTVTVVGTGVTNWVLTRATDFDAASAQEVAAGAAVVVVSGTVNAHTQWVETGQGPFTVDTTPIVFSQVTGGGSGTVNVGTANQLAYYSTSTNAVSGLASGANGVLVTDGSSVPSIGATLPTAVQNNITRTGALVAGSTGSGFTVAFGSATTTGTVPSANGGAGTITGALKGSGAGVVSQAACADLSDAQTGCSTVVGTAATAATGTSGHTLPFLDGANTWSATQAFGTVLTAPPVQRSGTTDTLAASDCGKTIEYTSASTVTVTLPNNISVLTGGCHIAIVQGGAGQVVFSAAGGGSLVSAHSYTKTFGQNAGVGLSVLENGTGTAAKWFLFGDGSV